MSQYANKKNHIGVSLRLSPIAEAAKYVLAVHRSGYLDG